MTQITNKDTRLTPAISLVNWVNQHPEWLRSLVDAILHSPDQLSDADITRAYNLFIHQKEPATPNDPPHPAIALRTDDITLDMPIVLERLAQVKGVNALTSNSEITFNPGLTLLFGENGTGKTGYSRIIKHIAQSRSDDDILSDINQTERSTCRSANISYLHGNESHAITWHGERGIPPLTRIAVFDSPASILHVNNDLAYVYKPSSLALFDYVTDAVKLIQKASDAEISQLLLKNSRMKRKLAESTLLKDIVRGLTADTAINEIHSLARLGQDTNTTIESLEEDIVHLRANTVEQKIVLQRRLTTLLEQAANHARLVAILPVQDYNSGLARLKELEHDHNTLRKKQFNPDELPAEPDPTWENFIHSGQAYLAHLRCLGRHDQTRCLYCRQTLDDKAIRLIAKYRGYLEDYIIQEIESHNTELSGITTPILDSDLTFVRTSLDQTSTDEEASLYGSPGHLDTLRAVITADGEVKACLDRKEPIPDSLPSLFSDFSKRLETQIASITSTVQELTVQRQNRDTIKSDKELELRQLKIRDAVRQSLRQFEKIVSDLKKSRQLDGLRSGLPTILRQVTDLAKAASDEMLNRNFAQLFLTERRALRSPEVTLEFIGRRGQAHRRRTLVGKVQPSQVLSEGEQKSLALADFIAEARLTGNVAPIVFDDPVSSLDHRRAREVAARIADLASDHQVIVFTHDIIFTTSLLEHFENNQRCTYYQITDEEEKGTVTLATGQRSDTIRTLKSQINTAIEAAQREHGDEGTRRISEAYGSIRSWCEVFVEREVLAEVTQRYQPNVRIGALSNIKASVLDDTIATVTKVYEDASRYIDSHSQPLPTLGVAPSLGQLREDWSTLQECRKVYLDA